MKDLEEQKKDEFYEKVKADAKNKSTGQWGGDKLVGLYSKKNYESNPSEKILHFQQLPNNCYIMQVCMTTLNFIVLSTKGKVYTWGGMCPCLGRKITKEWDAKIASEVDRLKDPITQIVSGKNHVLALDVSHRVYAWGSNTYGQLGTKDFDSTKSAEHPIEVTKLSDSEIVHIYANDNTSIAVAKDGKMFIWGYNKGGNVLGIDAEVSIREPLRVKDTPWSITNKTKFVMSDDVYLYNVDKPEINPEVLYMQKQLNMAKKQISELQSKIFALEARNRTLEGEIHDVSENKSTRNIGDDRIIKDLNRILHGYEINMEDIRQRIKFIKDDKELVKEEMKEQLKKRDQLLEAEIEKLERPTTIGAKPKENAQLVLKDRKELLIANNSVRTETQQKLTEQEDKLNELDNQLSRLSTQIDEIQSNTETYKQIQKERKRTLTHNYLTQHQNDLESLLTSIHSQFEILKRASVEELCKSHTQVHGMKDLIIKSNKSIMTIQKEIQGLKVDQNDPRFQIFRMVWEMLDDDITLRLKVNNYLEGLIDQTSHRLEELEQNNVNVGDYLLEEEDLAIKAEIDRHKVEQLENIHNDIQGAEDADQLLMEIPEDIKGTFKKQPSHSNNNGADTFSDSQTPSQSQSYS